MFHFVIKYCLLKTLFKFQDNHLIKKKLFDQNKFHQKTLG